MNTPGLLVARAIVQGRVDTFRGNQRHGNKHDKQAQGAKIYAMEYVLKQIDAELEKEKR